MEKKQKRNKIIYLIIGIYLILAPTGFIGFPSVFKNALYVISGSIILWKKFIEPKEDEEISVIR